MGYIPSTSDERLQMLATCGLSSFDELFSVVPADIRVKHLNLPDGVSELEMTRTMTAMAAKNKIFPTIFRGAGAYRHYIPAIVQSVTSNESFLTAYTPYQSEISQGILQSIFEYQTMICELTGMDASNASVYDGASAAAEAAAMCRDRKRARVLVSGASHPMVIETMRTYANGADAEMQVVPMRDGKTDLDALASMLDDKTACVYLAQPNYFGQLEDADKASEIIHAAGAKFIMGVNPLAASVLKTPRDCGADIAVGEGQPLGMPLAFGGPYLGFMAASGEMLRRLPGRIVGETVDADGRRAFVLTLQAREQHIRREKASSNICSNQALCALTAACYLSAMGPGGVQNAANQCYSKAHYAAEQLCKIPGVTLAHSGEFFHEFVTALPCDAQKLLDRLAKADILGGLPVEGGLLWCVTEMNTKEELDLLVELVKEVCGR